MNTPVVVWRTMKIAMTIFSKGLGYNPVIHCINYKYSYGSRRTRIEEHISSGLQNGENGYDDHLQKG
jgi:hypothetical protein